MHCRADPHAAVQATFSVDTLDKSTRTTDNAINCQLDITSILKHTFNPVVNLKDGVTSWVTGFTLLRMNTPLSCSVGVYWFRQNGHVIFAVSLVTLGLAYRSFPL